MPTDPTLDAMERGMLAAAITITALLDAVLALALLAAAHGEAGALEATLWLSLLAVPATVGLTVGLYAARRNRAARTTGGTDAA
jgi:hypothetical protein